MSETAGNVGVGVGVGDGSSVGMGKSVAISKGVFCRVAVLWMRVGVTVSTLADWQADNASRMTIALKNDFI